MRFEGKSVVVTGASSGMGYKIALDYAAEGATVIAVARRKERLEQLAAEARELPGKILVYTGDISSKEVNEGMIDFAVENCGKIDVLVNNAGIMDEFKPIAEVEDEQWERIMAVNLTGPMYAMRKAVQVFLEQGGGGNIINVASLGAFRSCAGAVYTASKAAVVSLSKNTAYMYMPQGIRCNVIAPGGIQTEISTSMGMPNMAGYGRVKNVLATAPAPGTAEQIANAALFLASDDSSYVNGDVLIVDGGWNAG